MPRAINYMKHIQNLMSKLRLKNRLFCLFQKTTNTIFFFCSNKDKIIILNVSMTTFGQNVNHNNIGDDLNFYLIQKLIEKNGEHLKIFNYCDIFHWGNTINKKKNYMCIGSIIDWMTNSNSVIWGSGVRDNSHKLQTYPYKVTAVRGPLTRNYLLSQGIDCPPIYGDPALLLPLFYKPKNTTKRFKIGIILHKNDINNISIKKFSHTNPDVTIIKIRKYKHWKDVIDQICQCEIIISSSLHGLILDDAYAIPNTWIKFSEKTFDGSFKYLDYFASVKRTTKAPIIISTQTLDINFLMKETKRNYLPISFNSTPLLKACPFIKC